MTEKELKRLNRRELLEMLIFQIKKNDRLQKRLDEALEELENRRIAIEESGTLAEAALKVNGVFEAAQKAADQYLDNIRLQYAAEQYLELICKTNAQTEEKTSDSQSETSLQADENGECAGAKESEKNSVPADTLSEP